ncbi:NUDIX domain-containing protein [Apiospora marii]|uniref:NUDIX domain-containing protein n=2 Tax=Apiospora marii TaxID=335849 RepID=A0ABR1RF98_9PEZI
MDPACIDDETARREYDEVKSRLDEKWEIQEVNKQSYNAQDWKKNNETAKCYDMKSLLMSFGTVTVRDKPGDEGGPQVLVFWNARHQSYQLPKGRRNLHESPADAALRETLEETGVQVKPRYLLSDTRIVLDSPETADDVELVRRNLDNETITSVNRDVVYAMSYDDKKTGAHRHVYFYAAQPARGDGESDAARLSDEDKTNKVRWFGFKEARKRLTMKAERAAVITTQILYERTRDSHNSSSSDPGARNLSDRLLQKWEKDDEVRRLSWAKPLARAVADNEGNAVLLAEAIKKILPDGDQAVERILNSLKHLDSMQGVAEA